MHIVKVMRVKSARVENVEYPEGEFSHNFGDLFYSNCTIIRVYGCPQPPHILPIIVSSRLALIKFMWQVMWMEKEIVKTEKKGQRLPRMIAYEEFCVGSDTLEKVQ